MPKMTAREALTDEVFERHGAELDAVLRQFMNSYDVAGCGLPTVLDLMKFTNAINELIDRRLVERSQEAHRAESYEEVAS